MNTQLRLSPEGAELLAALAQYVTRHGNVARSARYAARVLSGLLDDTPGPQEEGAGRLDAAAAALRRKAHGQVAQAINLGAAGKNEDAR